jgi:hypothetical protein
MQGWLMAPALTAEVFSKRFGGDSGERKAG